MNIDTTTIIGIVFAVIAIVALIIIKRKQKKSKNNKKSNSGKRNVSTGTSQKKGAKIPTSVRESIPYIHTFENGVIETEPGVFTRAYLLEDINFKVAPDDEQTNIFLKYGKLLNSFMPDVNFQVVIQNKNADKRSFFSSVQFIPQSDNLNPYRREMNDMMLDKLSEGRNNLAQNKYFIVSVKSQSYEEAVKKLDELDRMIIRRFREMTKETPISVMTLTDRLHNLYDTYNQAGEGSFYNALNKAKEPIFDLGAMLHMGLSTKDVIGPGGMEFHPGYFMINETYGRTLYLENIPTWLSIDFLSEISEIMCNLSISLHYTPVEQAKATKVVHNMMVSIDGQIADFQRKAGQDGYSIDLIPPEMMKQQKYARDLIEDMVSRDQKMYYVTFVITIFAQSKEEMEEYSRQVTTVASNHMCSFKTLFFQQENGLNASLPLCINELKTSKMLTTESASIFIPYTTRELHQSGGIYYGLNETSKNVIIYNRTLGENYNGLIFGESGNGKSFAAKQEMVSALLKDSNNVVYVIDPESEYSLLGKALGGTVIDLSPGSSSYINPLDMDIKYGDEADPVGMKAEFVISMIEIMLGNGRVITPEEKSIITRCVQAIYRPYLENIDTQNRAGANITSDKDSTPILSTLYNMILMQPELEAKGIASVLEMYANGTLATFSHRTNIKTDSRFVVYDIKNLGTGTKDLGIHICVNDIWNRMIENKRRGLYTWVYIDEFYLLLQSENTARFVSTIWKRARKWNGVPTGILQNTEDILRTTDARTILNNSSFIQMFSMRKIDRDNLGELLNISENQLAYITDAGYGRGLIYAGKTVLPFENMFPEDTKLFQLMNTKASKAHDYE